jgi:hypothetical protein
VEISTMTVAHKKTKSIIKSMSKKTLNKATSVIRKTNSDQQIEVTNIALVNGWEVKNYSSFKAFCNGELSDLCYDTLNLHRRIGLVVYHLAGKNAVGTYSGHAIKPLFKIEPKQQKKVWRELQDECGEKDIPPKWLTKAIVDRVIDQLGLTGGDVGCKESSESPKSETELKFMSSLKKDHLEVPYFSQRMAKCIKSSVSKKNRILMCKIILNDFESHELNQILNALKTNI